MERHEAARTVVWFRRDLRVADHPALTLAARRGPLVALFVIDPTLLARRHHREAWERRRFLRAGLEALAAQLQELGACLVVRHGAPERVVPALAEAVGADLVVASHERSLLGAARDRRVAAALAAGGVGFATHGGELIAEPQELPGPHGEGYRVFTPFFRAWSAIAPPPHLPAPSGLSGPRPPSDSLDLLAEGPSRIPAGAAAARARLVAWIGAGGPESYGEDRDRPAADATSGLSPHLRFGMCTAAQIGRALRIDRATAPGALALWRQLAWREFFHHLMARRPQVLRGAWRAEFAAISWDEDRQHFAAWCAGRTGYPLVDAAMRQLATEGWLHNRGRLVAASFLVKDLLIDWRRGESHFMRALIDGDPANNNGGWQWVAGTGVDAAPYFRVLNPVRQSERFDPDGHYIRRHVPELAAVPTAHIHRPWRMDGAAQRAAGCLIGRDYPVPIVDHATRREEALARYAAARADARRS